MLPIPSLLPFVLFSVCFSLLNYGPHEFQHASLITHSQEAKENQGNPKGSLLKREVEPIFARTCILPAWNRSTPSSAPALYAIVRRSHRFVFGPWEQELELLNQFDTKDRALSAKQDKQQHDKNEVVTAIAGCKAKLSTTQAEAEVCATQR